MFPVSDMRNSLQGDNDETEALCEENALPHEPNSALPVSRRRTLFASVALLGCVIGAIAYATYSRSSRSPKMMSKKMAAISLSGDLPKKAPEREAYTASTYSAAEVQCNDAPLYWVDTDGQGCGDYHRDHFCTPDGKIGYGWNPKWGSISHYASNGRDAFQACCQCGGGSAPVSTRPATKCAHGYAYSHEGWWDNWHTLHSPYGKVKHEHFVSTTECAAECTKTDRCIGYTLFQNQVCWLYNSFGGSVTHEKSIACISQTYLPPVTAAPPTYYGTPTPARPPLPRAPAGTGNYPADIMTCGVTPTLTTQYMDCELYNKISDRVQRMLEALLGIEMWTSNDGLTTPYADYAGCVLRVAGHDFMDFKKDVGGGADGCVDFTDPDNLGLQKCLVGDYASYASRPGYGGHAPSGYSYSLDNRGLIDAYQDVCDSVSLADFFVIAAEAVMMSTRRLSLDVFVQPIFGKDPSWYVNNQEFLEPYGNNLPGTSFSPYGFDFSNGFMYGRTTRKQCPRCTTSAQTNCNTPLPAAEGGCAENKRVFIENLGMTWEETTAIMGVHTLGQAHKENSGYDGWWSDVNNSQRMNNNYYISLAMKGWTPLKQDNGKSLWIRSDDWANPTLTEMMLDTDICLAHQSDTARNELEKTKVNGAKFCCNWWKNESSALCGYRETGVASTWSQSKCCDPPHLNINGDISFTNCQSDPTQLSGIAADAVLKYAFNEFDWMVDFEKSWRKATSVGQHYGGLKMLRPKTNGRICNNGHQRDYRSQGHV